MGSWVVGRNLPAGAALSGFYFIGIPAVKVFRCGIAMKRSILLVAFLVSRGSALPSQPLPLDDEMRIATYYVDNVDFTDERGATGDGSETLEIDQNVEGWVNGHPQWGNIDENDVEQILQLPEGEEESFEDRMINPWNRRGYYKADGNETESDMIKLPPGLEDDWDRGLAPVDARSLAATSCLKMKVFYSSGFCALFGNSDTNAQAAIVSLVKDLNARFAYSGLSTKITVDVVGIEYWAGAPNEAGSAIQQTYSKAATDCGDVHHCAFMAPGGPLPGVVGTAYLGTACLYSQYAGYKVSVNEYYSGRPGMAADVLAHEIGHGLGMYHDFYQDSSGNRYGYIIGGRPCTGINSIMDYVRSPNKWSPCSDYFLRRYMSSGGSYRSSGNCIPHSGTCNSGWDSSSGSSSCTDKKSYCPYLPDIYCYEWVENNLYRNTYCPNRCKTCDGGSGVTKPASQSGCSNSGYFSESVCSRQATPAVCAANPRAIMGCRSTCQTCGVCSDLAYNCGAFASYCNSLSIMKLYCMKTCNTC